MGRWLQRRHTIEEAMDNTPLRAFDYQALQARLKHQWGHLDLHDPSAWPTMPRYGLLLAMAGLVLTTLWFVWLEGIRDTLQDAQVQEVTLKEQYTTRLAKAVNLEGLKMQREQTQRDVAELEKQVPGRAEMDALLSDISQAGLRRSLQFDLFKPDEEVVGTYYVELPIALKVSGRYHDMVGFASDMAKLPRIVTLHNLSISPKPDGTLVLEATVKTFRYLDAVEAMAQKNTSVAAKK